MKIPVFGVYGASGFGREVMPLARATLSLAGVSTDHLVFIDDGQEEKTVNGQQVYSYQDFLGLESAEKHVVIAIANSQVREKLTSQLKADGVLPWSVQAANVVCMDAVTLQEGAILCPFVTLTGNIQIGKGFHANLYSYVAHDCIIGDFVTFAPRVSCNGNVIIEDHAYIGTGAVIRQGRPEKPIVIGRGAIVGMGAVVIKSVPAGVTVVGNPARPLVKA